MRIWFTAASSVASSALEVDQPRDLIEMLGPQHASLGEVQDEERTLGGPLPVDEVIDDEVDGLERQQMTDHLDVLNLLPLEPRYLGDGTEVCERVGPVRLVRHRVVLLY